MTHTRPTPEASKLDFHLDLLAPGHASFLPADQRFRERLSSMITPMKPASFTGRIAELVALRLSRGDVTEGSLPTVAFDGGTQYAGFQWSLGDVTEESVIVAGVASVSGLPSEPRVITVYRLRTGVS